ncbi:MAG TPA: hypothetical protein VLS48_05645 [Anaerolineales bacterium]|nr:hypothetical protein [Anaerolineales bacterium]
MLVLVGYFAPLGVLALVREVFIQWAVILAAVALVVGVINLLRVHARKISQEESGAAYSLITIVAFVVTVIVVGFLSGPTGEFGLWIFNYLQVPVETSLMALLAIILAYAAARLVQRRPGVFSWIFLGAALLVIASSVTLPFLDLALVRDGQALTRQVVGDLLATAGARGILLGVALGAIATGLRVILGADRPYGG